MVKSATSQVAHQAGAYPGLCSMKWLGVFILPPGWDASPLQGYPQHKFASTHLYTWVERGTVRDKCLAQEHNTMSPARTRTVRSGDRPTNHEATASHQWHGTENLKSLLRLKDKRLQTLPVPSTGQAQNSEASTQFLSSHLRKHRERTVQCQKKHPGR